MVSDNSDNKNFDYAYDTIMYNIKEFIETPCSSNESFFFCRGLQCGIHNFRNNCGFLNYGGCSGCYFRHTSVWGKLSFLLDYLNKNRNQDWDNLRCIVQLYELKDAVDEVFNEVRKK